MPLEPSVNYKDMQVGDRVKMPVEKDWIGVNQNLFREIQDYCASVHPHPQFQVDSVRVPDKELEFWLERTR